MTIGQWKELGDTIQGFMTAGGVEAVRERAICNRALVRVPLWDLPLVAVS